MKHLFRSSIALIILIFLMHKAPSQETAPLVNDTTYMLSYDHGGLILWGSDHFIERLRNATQWLDKYPSFKIGLDNEAQIYDYFAANNPEILNELKAYLHKYKGRLGIGSCTYGQPLSQFINDESNIRQIAYSLAATRKHFNYRPPVYLMSEYAMHSQIPQIINGFGFEKAIMRTHYMMYGYNPTFDIPIGWWTGIDGSRTPTIPTYTGQGAEFGKTTMDMWILTRYPGQDSKESMEVFRDRFKHIRPLLASRADDSDLRKEELVAEYEKKPMFKWVLLDDLFKIYPAPSEEMITLPNDFKVRMPWGYCGNEIWNASRKAETNILIAERLAALETLSGGNSYQIESDAAWKDLLLAQHHDVQIVGLLPDARRLLFSSNAKSEKIITDAMAFFAENMKGEGIRQITVFNPLGWRQSRWIIADVSLHKGEASNFIAKCGDTEIPVRIISSDRYSDGSILEAKIAFKAELEPLSITSWSIIPAEKESIIVQPLIQADEKSQIILTPFYEVRLAENGGITSIKDKKSGLLITENRERAVFFEGLIDGKNVQSAGMWIIRKSDSGTPWITITEYGFISDIPYEFEIVLYEDDPRIDCKVKFDFNGQKIGLLSNNLRDSYSPFLHEEKLRFVFFPKLGPDVFGIRDLPFAIAETNDRYVEGNYWTSISDGKSGIAFFNKGNMGSVRHKDGSFSIPLAYAMYYVWGTRMLYGPYHYEFSILPYNTGWKEANLHRKALEYNFHIPKHQSNPQNGKQGTKVKPIHIETSNDIIMTAFYAEGNSIFGRFFKSDDTNISSGFLFSKEGSKLTETKLDGTFIKEISGKIDLKPWEIKTISFFYR